MKIYLDLCALQRPLDTKDQLRISVEAEAVLSVLSLFESGRVELISSEALLFEAAHNPNPIRREYVLEILRNTKELVELNTKVEKRAAEFTGIGIQPLDALHLACAEVANVDYFCTCDDKFLKRAKNINNLKVKAVSPIEITNEIEE